jgi:anti-sigma factor RsiW
MCVVHPTDDDLEMYVLRGTDPEGVSIEEHVRGCAPCARRLAETKEYIEAMRAALEQWTDEDHT